MYIRERFILSFCEWIDGWKKFDFSVLCGPIGMKLVWVVETGHGCHQLVPIAATRGVSK